MFIPESQTKEVVQGYVFTKFYIFYKLEDMHSLLRVALKKGIYIMHNSYGVSKSSRPSTYIWSNGSCPVGYPEA